MDIPEHFWIFLLHLWIKELLVICFTLVYFKIHFVINCSVKFCLIVKIEQQLLDGATLLNVMNKLNQWYPVGGALLFRIRYGVSFLNRF